MPRHSASTIAYWTTTVLVASTMAAGGIGYLIHADLAVERFRHLGYPLYMLAFIGTAKLLGALTLVVPRTPRLKEWAYAGILINMTGGFYSHLSSGDPVGLLVPSLSVALLALTSWALRPASRRLGAVLPDATARAPVSTREPDFAAASS